MTANLPTSLVTIGGDDLAGDQPVDQHADRGEVLLGRRLRIPAAWAALFNLFDGQECVL